MMIEVWVVKMPNGDRPYTSAVPPSPEIAAKWLAQGARLFRMHGTFPDDPPEGRDPEIVKEAGWWLGREWPAQAFEL